MSDFTSKWNSRIEFSSQDLYIGCRDNTFIERKNQINHSRQEKIIDKHSLCFLLRDLSLLLLFNLMTKHRAGLLWFVLSLSLSLATIILIKGFLSSYPTVLSIAMLNVISWSNQAKWTTKERKRRKSISSMTKAPYCYLNIFSDICGLRQTTMEKKDLSLSVSRVSFLDTYKYCC